MAVNNEPSVPNSGLAESLCDLLSRYQDEENMDLMVAKNSFYTDENQLAEVTRTRGEDFKVLSLNINSVLSKYDELCILIENLKDLGVTFNAICLQECRINKDTDENLFQLQGYTSHFTPYVKTRNGGLITYISEDYVSKKLNTYKTSDIWEGLHVEVSGGNLKEKLNLINLYRPPRDDKANYTAFTEELCQLLEVIDVNNADTIISGDFNINLLEMHNTGGNKKSYHDFYTALTAKGLSLIHI